MEEPCTSDDRGGPITSITGPEPQRPSTAQQSSPADSRARSTVAQPAAVCMLWAPGLMLEPTLTCIFPAAIRYHWLRSHAGEHIW